MTFTRSGVWLLLAVIVLGVAAAGVWWWRPPAVSVVHPVRGPAVQAVYATGTVESSVMMPIAARLTARLVRLDIDEGQRVHKDQVMGQLEDEDLKHTLAQLRSQETFAKSDYDRDVDLLKDGLVTRAEFDRAQSAWRAAKAASARAAAELDFAKLIAPADGQVIRRDGEIGQLIPINQPVFWISVESPPRISAEVDEEDVARVAPGQEVLIRADAFPGRIFHGRVQSITPKGDPVARSYRVRIDFTESTPLQIGMTTETNIVIHENPQALLVPSTAVQADHLWLARDGRLESRPVSIGARGGKTVEIMTGVAPDDLVVVSPDPSMRAGQRVRSVLVTTE